jgi:hypothetical protein
MGKVEKIATQRDSARVALAECILDRDAKAKATELARSAVAKSNDLVSDAERHAEAVKIALSSARDGREARLRQAVEGGTVIEKPASTREQRFAELDAADELEIARKVLSTAPPHSRSLSMRSIGRSAKSKPPPHPFSPARSTV